MVRKDLGMVTAYAYAVSKGYTGTEAEFAELMASYASVAQEAVDAALAAAQSAQAAASARDTAQTTVAGAIAGIQAEGQTQVSNVNTAGGTQVSAVQAKGTEVLNSIPADYSTLSGDVTDLKSAISTMEDNAIPVCEAASNVYISIADGAKETNVESLNVMVAPNTDGFPVTVYRTGKNILPLTVSNIKAMNTSGAWSGDAYTYNGITYTLVTDADGNVTGITTSGTASADSSLFLISFLDYLIDGASYILSGCPENGGLTTFSIRWVTTNFAGASSDIGSGTTLKYSKDWTRVYIDIKSGTTINATFQPMIRLESEKDGSFDVYTQDTTVSTATLFGGSAELVSGKAIKTYDGVKVNTLNWVREANANYTRYYTLALQGRIKAVANNDSVGGVLCDGYETDTINAIFGLSKNNVVAVSATGAVSINDNSFATTADFLSANGEKTLAFELITPEPETFDPVELTTAKGKNIIWSNVGNVSVTYRADSQLYGDTHHHMFAEEYKRYEETQVAEYLTVGLPILELSGDVTGMTKENAVKLIYSYKGNSGSCTLKWQGASSLAYQKKNYTIKFGKNITLVDAWGAHKKYVLKANYIDPTHARNVVSCKLWGQMVKSRAVQNPYLYPLVNGGAIDGFPVILVLNGAFHGLYTLNIPKDDWMFGMTGAVAHEGIIGAETHSEPTRFNATVTAADLEAETSFSVEYTPSDDDVEWIATSLSQAITAVKNATSAADKTTIAQYIDIDSAIDYYILMCLILGIDCTDKNYLLATFDGTKWYFSAYDLDSTYGSHWAGGRYLSSTSAPTFSSYAALHKMMGWIYNYDRAALKARYAELRADILSVSNVTNMFYNFCVQIPKPIKDMELLRWNLIPASDTTDAAQLVAWYRERVEVMDAEINAL